MSTLSMPVRIFLRDVPSSLMMQFAIIDEVDLISQVDPGYSLVAFLAALAPDVVVLNMSTPGHQESSSLLIQQIRIVIPCARILVIAEHTDHIMRAIQAGATGYLPVQADEELVFTTLQLLLHGRGLLTQPVSHALLSFADALTPQERRVLALSALGSSLGDIERVLEIDAAVVKRLIGNIFVKVADVPAEDVVATAYALAEMIPGTTPDGVSGPTVPPPHAPCCVHTFVAMPIPLHTGPDRLETLTAFLHHLSRWHCVPQGSTCSFAYQLQSQLPLTGSWEADDLHVHDFPLASWPVFSPRS